MVVPNETQQFVLEQLDRSALKRDAFECRFDVDDNTAIFIMVRGSEHNRFILGKAASPQADRPWEVRESPGPMFRGFETARFQTFDEAVGYLGDWLQRVEEEAAL